MSSDRIRCFAKPVVFFAVFLFLLWLAHALGYLVHEYAHSFTAWGLGYKTNPLALHYGHLDWNNLLTLDDIDENVDYDPIFAAGRGPLAALIAVAGVLFGNGIFYLISRHLYMKTRVVGRYMLALFLFLFCMMNAGNLISYVPARTFAMHADMATVEKGLSLSPWWVAILLGVPFCIAVGHFITRLLPGAMRFFFPDSKLGQVFLLVLTAYVVFKFFGGAGLSRYGPISHWISVFSIFALLPLTVILCWPGSQWNRMSLSDSAPRELNEYQSS